MSDVVVGSLAPDFTLTAASGDSFTLSQQRGRPVVLYFYPQDDTEGCTVENLEFTRLLPEFSAHGAVVAGISPDSVADHCRFRDKYELGTLLLADPDHLAIDAYGLWQPKRTFGRDYMGLVRTTILVGADGRIARVWTVRRIRGHAQQVLDALRSLAD